MFLQSGPRDSDTLDSTPESLPAGDVAVLTVCAGRDIVDKVNDCAAHISSPRLRADSDAYFSSKRRPALAPELIAAHACVALVDFDRDFAGASETASMLHQLVRGKVFVVALSEVAGPQIAMRAMQAGCIELLQKPVTREALDELFERLKGRWSSAPDAHSHGRILSFCGAKGGVGTTTMAVHLAVHLAERHRKRVLLVDNHVELGHVCLYLGMAKAEYSFDDLLRNVDRLDSELLSGFVSKRGSGLHVLASPEVAREPVVGDDEALEKVLRCFRANYDFVIVDSGTVAVADAMAGFGASDQLYVVVTPEIGAVRDLARYADRLRAGGSQRRVSVVLNRYSAKNALSWTEISQRIALPFAAKVPNTYAELVDAINLGQPIAPDAKGDFSRELRRWADELAGDLKLKSSRKGALQLWR